MKLTLRGARANVGLSQAEAGKKIGVTRFTIASWEAGRSFPNAVQIRRIEEIYGLKYDDLLFLAQKYA